MSLSRGVSQSPLNERGPSVRRTLRSQLHRLRKLRDTTRNRAIGRRVPNRKSGGEGIEKPDKEELKLVEVSAERLEKRPQGMSGKVRILAERVSSTAHGTRSEETNVSHSDPYLTVQSLNVPRPRWRDRRLER